MIDKEAELATWPLGQHGDLGTWMLWLLGHLSHFDDLVTWLLRWLLRGHHSHVND